MKKRFPKITMKTDLDGKPLRRRKQKKPRQKKPTLPVTGFWMRNYTDGKIEVLAMVKGKWIVVFGDDGPGPVARDPEQLIDHCIHAGGIQNLLDYGNVHGRNTVTPARECKPNPRPR